MNKKVAQFLVKLLHPTILESGDAQFILRAQVTVLMALMSIVLLPIPMTLEYLEYGNEGLAIHISNVLLQSSAIASLFFIKYKGRVSEVATIFISACVLSVFVTAYHGRGLGDSSLTWIVLGPYAASLLVGTGSAVITFLVGAIGMLGMTLVSLELTPITPPNSWDSFTPILLVQVLLPLLFSGALAIFQMVIFSKAYEIVNETQEELLEERQKLFHSQKLTALGEMAGGIAHEINNPICIIQGRASTISKGLQPSNKFNPEKMRKAVDSILQTTDRVTKIVNTMRRIAKINDQANEEMYQLDLTKEIDDAITLAGMKLQQHEIGLRVNTPDENLWVLGHEGNISQVLLSMLSNATDAIKDLEDRWIEINFKDIGTNYSIQIKDSGPGIPKDILDKIFQPFFTTKPTGSGTGMGLGICLTIVNEMNGSLKYVEGEKNTTFAIILPKGQVIPLAS